MWLILASNEDVDLFMDDPHNHHFDLLNFDDFEARTQ